MRAFVYHEETRNIVARIEGENNEAVEAAFNERYSTDGYALTYSPALTAWDGLIMGDDVDDIDA